MYMNYFYNVLNKLIWLLNNIALILLWNNNKGAELEAAKLFWRFIFWWHNELINFFHFIPLKY